MALFKTVLLITFAMCTVSGTSIAMTNTRSTQIPYQISLRHKIHNIHLCSGVIVSPFLIISSARCVHTFNDAELKLCYGSRRSNQTRDINKIIVHPEFNADNFENDIALLLTESKIEFQTNVASSISLATKVPVHGESVTASGWALKKKLFDNVDEYSPDNLQCQQTTIMAHGECTQKTGTFSRFLHGNKSICIHSTGDLGIFKGDLGSPLVSNEGYLIGIAAWFMAGEGKPDVYTAIVPYFDWIQSYI